MITKYLRWRPIVEGNYEGVSDGSPPMRFNVQKTRQGTWRVISRNGAVEVRPTQKEAFDLSDERARQANQPQIGNAE